MINVAAHVLRFAKFIGGTDASIEDFPWQVSLLRAVAVESNSTEVESQTEDDNEQSPLEQYCNGAIIAPNAILTSAHCVRLNETNVLSPEEILARVGSADRNTGGLLHTVAITVVHPDYNDATWENDLAILFLSENITYSPSASNISLADNEIDDNQTVTLTSWENESTESETDDDASDVLQAIELTTVNQEVCVEGYQPTTAPDVTENNLCAGNQDGVQGFTQVIGHLYSNNYSNSGGLFDELF